MQHIGLAAGITEADRAERDWHRRRDRARTAAPAARSPVGVGVGAGVGRQRVGFRRDPARTRRRVGPVIRCASAAPTTTATSNNNGIVSHQTAEEVVDELVAPVRERL